MMVRPALKILSACAGPVFGAVLAALAGASAAQAGALGTAVVPTAIIYPGQSIGAGDVQEVDVTNPNLTGDYARTAHEVVGLISKRTLLPGRTIDIAALREPWAMTRGSTVRLVFSVGAMTISAAGSPLVDAAVGDVIRARNLDSGIIVSGTVMADGTLQVVAK